MRVPGRESLAFKITMVMLTASAVSLLTLSTAFLTFDSGNSRTLLHNRLSTLADVVGQNSTAAVSFNDPLAATEILAALHAEPSVVSACLYDLSGRLFAGYQRPKAYQACAAILTQVPSADRDFSRILRPVLNRGEAVATLYLSSDLEDLKRRRSHLLWLACGLLLIALTVGGVFGFILQRRISRPIFDLVQAMRDVTTRQDFAVRVSISGADEISQLGSGFNMMLSELQSQESETKAAKAKLTYQALNDELTGLPNRRLLTARLSQALSVAERERFTLALLYIDLDGFKLVNDSLGHLVGDILLSQVATRMSSRIRKADTLARMGGDEFTVVLAHVHGLHEAESVAREFLKVLSTPFLIDEHKVTISASIGISIFPDSGKDGIDLLQQADCAMYAAKQNGKNKLMHYTPELGSSIRERTNLEALLRGAMERGEISVHYQPEFDAISQRLVRFEALARWNNPSLGMISPSKFIPIAEESGIIVAMGAYVMEAACKEALGWQSISPKPIPVAVNVSSVQFERDGFVESVSDILNRTGLRPSLLQIELTESVMLHGVKRSANTMKRLRELGVSLAIDDFGTGYSCLSYLRQLPFDVLKIDRSFVQDLDVRPETQAVIHSLVALALDVGMRVIVEGVETQEQLKLVRELGCHEIQGFLLGRPTADPASQIPLLLPRQLEGCQKEAKSIAFSPLQVAGELCGT